MLAITLATAFWKGLGFNIHAVEEANGHSGDIWVLYNVEALVDCDWRNVLPEAFGKVFCCMDSSNHYPLAS
ncbi:hypothetical protein VNO77_44689 [Canavalia gladiata]|uniref:Uncharacterized protein n=1 Tax=Canavalia gladiata TaxID=3824 RepID=A0AAN9JYN8_CANGL